MAVCVPAQAMIVAEQFRRVLSPVPLRELHEDGAETLDGETGLPS
jgi:hypothetical protein